MSQPATAEEPLRRTPLHELHQSLGARMVPFAGYDMPVQYRSGILAEHLHTRAACGLFDVSHMGQAHLVGAGHDAVARVLEQLVPGDVLKLAPGRVRYTQLINSNGGIIDDLMVTRPADAAHDGTLYLVVNASRKALDFSWLEQHLSAGASLEPLEDRALVALQGPRAEAALARQVPGIAGLAFMAAVSVDIAGVACHVSRSGYTGEDGFELSIPAASAMRLVETFLADPDVKPVGLGARDSLRLEAGLCLYGHDIDDTTSPVEADLSWSIARRRREEGGFVGSDRIRRELKDGPARRRVGLRPEGRAPAREGTEIHNRSGRPVGVVTSGGFGPTVGGPIAMGYVEAAAAAPGTALDLMVRGKPVPAAVAPLPFVPHRYKR